MNSLASFLLATNSLLTGSLQEAPVHSQAVEQVQTEQKSSVSEVLNMTESTPVTTDDVIEDIVTKPVTPEEKLGAIEALHESTAEMNEVLRVATEDVWQKIPEYIELQTLLKKEDVTNSEKIRTILNDNMQILLQDGLTVDETLQLKTKLLQIIADIKLMQVRRQAVVIQSKPSTVQQYTSRPWYTRDTNPLWIIASFISVGQFIHYLIIRRSGI